ncbi:ATP-binding protein [Actinoallomurus sp. NPDC050550]|uniref:ATP-binding protein n=1 Tax=Actinoallomurus sp. NPDC050550 TaxID=3154937 RepID=UPI003404FC58
MSVLPGKTTIEEDIGMSATSGIEGEEGEAARRPDVYRFPLPPHPIAAEQARIFTRLVLADWNIPDVADNALLVAAELVTNAMKLGDVLSIGIFRRAAAVLIEVNDNSEASPDRRSPALDRVDGRGLLLVAACSKDWGWRLDEQGGKTVWAIVGGCDESAGAATPSYEAED